MEHPHQHAVPGFLARAFLALLAVWASLPIKQAFAENDSVSGLEARLQQVERQSAVLAEENRSLRAELAAISERVAADEPAAPGEAADSLGEPRFIAGYNDGFVIEPTNLDETPFSLRFNSQTMFREALFARSVRTWTDSAGVVSPVSNRNNFEIPRGRLIFSGHALLPRLSYYLNIDYNTVTTQPIGFRGYWLSYEFSEALTLHVGQNKVPGSREWLTSSLGALGPDRSLATTFFRPSLSQGIWITGEPVESLYYHAMLSNGFNTLNSPPDELDTRFCWSGSIWWEPWGSYGATYSDLEWHDESAIRMGTSLTYAAEQGQQGDPDAPENADIRLTDGTVITDVGAFAPGVSLQQYKVGLAAFDFGWKRRGVSISAEFYLQDLFGLRGNGPLPLGSTFAYGGFVQAGWFVMPQKLEIYSRTSQVTGRFGTGSEYAGGFNYFFLPGKNNLRFTLDATWVNHSPADQNRTNYRAGDTGFLLRTQIQMHF